MNLWIGNIAPGTTDEELKAFLVKYGAPEFTSVQHVPGDGSRPAAIVVFEQASAEVLAKLVLRLNGMYWKERSLLVQTLLRS